MAGQSTSVIFESFNILSEGRAQLEILNATQVITLQPNTFYEVITANNDIIITVNAATLATKGAFAYFKLTKGGTGNAIIRSTSIIDGEPLSPTYSEQLITIDGEGFSMIDMETYYATDRNTRLDLTSLWAPTTIISTSSNPITPSKATYYLVDASAFEANFLLPDVVAGNTDWFYFSLKANSNHCNLSTVSGQAIRSSVSQSLSTVNGTLLVVGNGVDGYDILLDTRAKTNVIPFSTDLDLLSGFESGATYEGSPADGVTITVTVKNWDTAHVNDFCYFTKLSGVGSTIRIHSVDNAFDEIILQDKAQFELKAMSTVYSIGQDSRPSPSDTSITLYALTEASTIPTYNRATTTTDDPDFSFIATDVPIGPITALAQLVGVFVTDPGVIVGLIPSTNTLSIANWRRTAGNGTAQAYAEIYRRTSVGIETLLATTNKTLPIESATYIQNSVSALIPETTFASTDSVVIKTYMDRVPGGADPSYDLQAEGTNPARLAISIPSGVAAHNAGAGVNLAGTGEPRGHLDDQTQDIYGNKLCQNQLHAGFFTETFSSAITFDFDNGNNQYVEITGNTTIEIDHELPGMYRVALEIDSVSNPVITIGVSFGTAIDYTPDLLDNDNDENIISIWVYPSGIVRYTIDTITA